MTKSYNWLAKRAEPLRAKTPPSGTWVTIPEAARKRGYSVAGVRSMYINKRLQGFLQTGRKRPVLVRLEDVPYQHWHKK